MGMVCYKFVSMFQIGLIYLYLYRYLFLLDRKISGTARKSLQFEMDDSSCQLPIEIRMTTLYDIYIWNCL